MECCVEQQWVDTEMRLQVFHHYDTRPTRFSFFHENKRFSFVCQFGPFPTPKCFFL
jgi:hypothetical protein